MIQAPVSLRQILGEIPLTSSTGDWPDLSIAGVAIDSRKVVAGDLFVCLKGGSADGHAYIPQAIARGAVAIAGEEPSPGLAVPYIRFDSSRAALSWLAAAFYGWPGRHLRVVGVTGTDGKTTTTNLIYQELLAAGIPTGMISTVNAAIGDEILDTGFHVTTPDAPDVQRYLAQMVAAGLTHAVLETTSHGWAQHRVDACEFDIGVVTNITHEHLDQHGTYESYRAAKARLFAGLESTLPKAVGNPRLAVLNRDDASFDYLHSLVRVKELSYGLANEADVRAVGVDETLSGIRFEAVGRGFRVAIESPLLGAYNVSNCLAALSTAVGGLGLEPHVAARGIGALRSIPGRMERINMGQDFGAIVDFAHTPNALGVTLAAARRLLARGDAQSRLIAVFGSAGLRDKQKRRMMAETSARLADLTILTAEDPRSESLGAILEDMAEGARRSGGTEGTTFWRVPDRGEAIRTAVAKARRGDIVLACGKGHEQSMCFGSIEYPWDDRVAMRAALAERVRVAGPSMPYLPTRDQAEADWLR